MVILKDTLEKQSLIREAVAMFKELTEKYPDLSTEEVAIIYPELMTNLRGVSMRKGR